MKQLLQKTSEKPWVLAKRFAMGILAISWLIMPELLWHKLTFLVHIVYESGSFLLEELLIHGLNMQKFYAQMTTFYFFLSIALLMLYWLYLRLPSLIQQVKNGLLHRYLQAKYSAKEAWEKMPLIRKIKLVLYQLTGVAGGALVLLF